MALTQITTSGLANGAVTSDKISNTVQLGGPTITQIQITDSNYDVLDDTAVSTSGGYIKITGTGFAAGAIVVIGSVNATSTGFVSSTVLNVQVPALSAGTYTVYVVNSNGGTAIGVNGLTYSAEPNWVTGSTLPSGSSGSAISIQLDATEATTYTLEAGSSLPDGLTLTSGGLLSGTVTVGIETIYSFTVVATDAQSQDSPRAFTITITSGDPYFYLTTLLLPGNGTNNGTNNTFLDSSTNNYTITRVGNTTQGTFTPYSLTGWSNYFDGSGDRLTIADNTALRFGTGDFTIEFWMYPNQSNAYMRPIGTGNTEAGAWSIILNNDATFTLAFAASGVFSSAISYSANIWQHIAIVRSGTTISCFVNGTRQQTTTSSYDLNAAASVFIGYTDAASSQAFLGYMSNVRLVKGTAVYDPSLTTLSVPTSPLTSISGTSLLTCQSNRFIDNSTNNFTITRVGNTNVQSFSPFNPTSSYSTSTIGGSALFDGNGDELTFTTQSFAGADNFCFESWVYVNSLASDMVVFGGPSDATGGADNVQLSISSAGAVGGFFGGPSAATSNGVIITGTWYHIAWTRNSGTAKIYVNGVETASASNSTTGNVNRIGSVGSASTRKWYNGYLSGARIVQGSAVYTSNFSVPTSPPTNIANTAVLCNFTNGQITDATSKNVLETVGDAKISTDQSKFGGSSIYFDGTGDALYMPSNVNLDFGTGDFTIECWARFSALSTNRILLDRWASGNANSWQLYWRATGSSITFYVGSAVLMQDPSNSRITTNTWYHIAVSRSGTSCKMFIDGTEVANATSSVSLSNALPLYIAEQGSVSTSFMNGYMDDIRITKGYARYTSNFTPPTSAFQTQ